VGPVARGWDGECGGAVGGGRRWPEVGAYREGVEAAVATFIFQWSGGGTGGRSGQEARGMGGGGSVLLEKGREWGRKRKKEVAMGGARFKWCTEVVNGSVGWHHASRVEEGTRCSARRWRLAGKGPKADGCERRWPWRAARARAHSDRGERGLSSGPLL
jgi:hypothetical protein